MAEARAQNPGVAVEVWAFDEHRIGLKPITRRVWAKVGRRPSGRSCHRYQWLYLYGFVAPSRGEVVWYLFNTVNAAAFQKTLEAFARETGAGRTKIIILVLDNAGWHVSLQIKPPKGLRLVFLPPYSPELQPAERLWPLTNEVVANRAFQTLDELDQTLAQRCLQLAENPNIIKAHTNFSWWPQT